MMSNVHPRSPGAFWAASLADFAKYLYLLAWIEKKKTWKECPKYEQNNKRINIIYQQAKAFCVLQNMSHLPSCKLRSTCIAIGVFRCDDLSAFLSVLFPIAKMHFSSASLDPSLQRAKSKILTSSLHGFGCRICCLGHRKLCGTQAVERFEVGF